MTIHIALYKWKSGATKEQVMSCLKKVQELKSKVDGIVDIFVGENYHKESKGLTYGVVVIARSQQALDAYRSHTDHSIVAAEIESIEEDGLGFDFKNTE